MVVRRIFFWIGVGVVASLFLISFTGVFLKQRQVSEGEKFCRDDIEYILVPSLFRKFVSECKSDLSPIPANSYSDLGCMYPLCSSYVCTKCGDGMCGRGENYCNCQADCRKIGEGDPNEDELNISQ